MTSKILVVGSAAGSIKALFSKITSIDAKHGKFDLVLCIGDFFGPPKESSEDGDEVEDLLAGRLHAPIECYIMQGEYPLPHNVIDKFTQTNGELAKNVFLLTKSGLVTTANGLRIGCLGGIFENTVYSSSEAAPACIPLGFSSPFFSVQTTERLLSNTLSKGSSVRDYKSLASIQSSATSSQRVDVLLTNAWPSAITQLSSTPLPQSSLASTGCYPLDDIVKRLQPRYHFAALGGKPPVFWEREPYVWEDDSTEARISRFISLGSFGGESQGKKQRWFYAFSISPAGANPRPPNTTKNPFTEGSIRSKRTSEGEEPENFIFGNVRQPKRARMEQGTSGKPPAGYKCHRCQSSEHFIDTCPERVKPPEGYVCRICNTAGHLVRDCPTRHAVGDTGGKKPKPGYVCRACGSENHFLEDCLVANQSSHGGRERRHPPKEIGPGECWFCLSNPNLAKHLIVSIGAECYLTLPKGQIPSTQSPDVRKAVPGGGHVLIVPITHYPTYSTIPSDLALPILEETEKYKTALRAIYAKHQSVAVFFEVGRLNARGGHAHVQAVPIPRDLQDQVESAFLKEGQRQGIDFEGDSEAALESAYSGASGYFKVDLPDGKKMIHLMKNHVPFSVNFGRQVLVTLLGTPDRFDWKACALDDEAESHDAQTFKAAFEPFDPAALN
ncbi:nuclear protein [Pluteus cervinus]|uniref:Nuclear protein n=1 Tax=Pluteus cervinus TaxID=181527 RepID=A0ACD3BE37_9AGAR|nr:nuclear protein [Pluteus cervinus]